MTALAGSGATLLVLAFQATPWVTRAGGAIRSDVEAAFAGWDLLNGRARGHLGSWVAPQPDAAAVVPARADEPAVANAGGCRRVPSDRRLLPGDGARHDVGVVPDAPDEG